ncbi:Cacna1h [Symbiodinium natans]|uniref:Cacna1h protein n=1 Tax=Symbiodinium natans TaxID=878477 RepID=A0A812UZ65_9DINO|nr:Cacna1h [Symbiodinium natans]
MKNLDLDRSLLQGQRRDSRIVPNPEIHRLLARIKKQDSTPQVQTLDPPSAGLWLRLRLRCQVLVRTVWFECFISAVIVANSVMIGLETQMGLHGQALTWAGAAELGFLAIYTVELLIRSIAEQWACLTDWWFIFDFTLVVSACVEQVVYRFTGDEADQIMILRLLRLIRLVRTFRMLRQIRSIWRLVYGLITCGETMFSTFALLGLVIYVFGVLGVEVIAGNEELQSNATTAPILAKYFGSLGMTMMTLSQFVTMDSIAPVYVPLVLEQPLLLLYFLPLGAIVSISLMNLITAVLVEGALEHARQDREEERKLDNITAKQMLPEIVGLFDKMDLDGSGEIGIEEMIQFEKPGSRVMNRRILDRASVDSMEDLFKILDVDGSGRITRAEFEEGLLSIFLREVPISSLQIMRMLRLLRDAVSELQQDVKGFPPQLKGLAAVPSTNRHTWAEMRPAKRLS